MHVRRIIILLSAVIAAVAILLSMLLTGDQRTIAVSTPTPEIAVVTDAPLPQPQDASSLAPESRGVPGIRPRVSAAAGGAAFEGSDVVAWLKSNPFAYRQQGKPEPQITTVDFITAVDASERLRLPLSLPDDYKVCVVMLRGDFLVPGEDPPLTGTTGFIVFDATSGNVIVHGIKP